MKKLEKIIKEPPQNNQVFLGYLMMNLRLFGLEIRKNYRRRPFGVIYGRCKEKTDKRSQ